MRIALLLVGQGIEMFFDLKSHNAWRRVSQKVCKLLAVHCRMCTTRMRQYKAGAKTCAENGREKWLFPGTGNFHYLRKAEEWSGRDREGQGHPQRKDPVVQASQTRVSGSSGIRLEIASFVCKIFDIWC